MLMEAVGNICVSSQLLFKDAISNDHTVHLAELCQSISYTDPLCHVMLKVESRALFDTTGGLLQVGFSPLQPLLSLLTSICPLHAMFLSEYERLSCR